MYNAASIQSGFNCYGCDGAKCCSVDLVIHTSLEICYIREGLLSLDELTQSRIIKKSLEIVKFKRLNPTGLDYRNSICAANHEGMCAIYKYRPMICRLAGIPHFVDRRDHIRTFGPGCPRFENSFRMVNPSTQIDRTPFYSWLAQLEIEVIQKRKKRSNSLTIAEIFAD